MSRNIYSSLNTNFKTKIKMKKIISLTTLLILSLSICFSQNNTIIEERTVEQFNKISICCGIDVYITQGTSSTIIVETNAEEMLSNIKTDVKNDELIISVDKQQKNYNNLKMKVHVTANNLIAINASSGADVYSVGQLTANNIDLQSTSGADIKLDIKANNLKAEASSGSDIKLKGSAEYANVMAHSGADVKMKEMEVKNVDAKASSGADIDLYVTNELNASANSAADITYKGNPKTVNQKKDSSSDIQQKN